MIRRHAMTLIELLVVIAIIGVLAALILAGVQKVRESASRAACQNHIKQIALGMQHLADQRGTLPRGIYDPLGSSPFPASGWQIPLLPFVEQTALHDEAMREFRRDREFSNNGIQHAGLSRFVKIFACPSDGRIGGPVFCTRYGFDVATTSYLGNCGLRCSKPDGVLFIDSQVAFREITDGLSNTILVGERPPSPDFRFGWWYAGIGQASTGSAEMILGARERHLGADYSCGGKVYEYTPGSFRNACDSFHFWSPHAGGAWFGFCDGSVRFLKYSANPIMPDLASRAGGEAVAVVD